MQTDLLKELSAGIRFSCSDDSLLTSVFASAEALDRRLFC